jgi:uncharacterized protein YbbK (DUF523 family)
MRKILLSACLAGEPVRYNGEHKRVEHAILARWQAEGRLVHVCPELEGGLTVPRPPAEILGDGGGLAVLQGAARVADAAGTDLTASFLAGAQRTLEIARAHQVTLAVLTDRSPSCGSTVIHDGTFGPGLRPGLMGVAAALLHAHGIPVFHQHNLDAANLYLQSLEP